MKESKILKLDAGTIYKIEVSKNVVGYFALHSINLDRGMSDNPFLIPHTKIDVEFVEVRKPTKKTK